MMNDRPAIILSALENIDLIASSGAIKSAGTVLGFKQEVRAGLKIDTLSVSIPISPYLGSRVPLSNERIIAGHGPIVVQAQGLAAQRVSFLRQLAFRCIARRTVTRA